MKIINAIGQEIAKHGGIREGNHITRRYTGTNGFYAWLDLTPDSIQDIINFLPELHFDVEKVLDLHLTVMYSPVAVDLEYALIGDRVETGFYASAKVIEFTYWEGHKKDGVLVMKLDPTNLVRLHNKWIAGGAKPTFSPYEPHVTLKTPIANTPRLKQFIKQKNQEIEETPLFISVVNEQIEDLD